MLAENCDTPELTCFLSALTDKYKEDGGHGRGLTVGFFHEGGFDDVVADHRGGRRRRKEREVSGMAMIKKHIDTLSRLAVLVAIVAYCLIRDTPQSCGLPPVEKWRNDYGSTYSDKAEETLPVKEIFKTVLSNKYLWYIAFANAFVYMVRYGCLDWAPAILTERGVNLKDAGWAYFAYEIAAIPGTLICGWLSDKLFHGRRALPTVLFMLVVAVFIVIYWLCLDDINVVLVCLIGIGFFIYGPVMLIGVQSLDMAPKNVAGTAAGLTGFMGYVLGTALLANVLIGYVAQHAGWNWTFVLLVASCFVAVVLMLMTHKAEMKKN